MSTACSKGFPGSAIVKNLPARTEDAGDSGRSPEGGNGSLLQYSCLENSVDRGAWRATGHGVARVKHNLATERAQHPAR